MKCQRVREEVKAYIDRELGPVARWRVSRHLGTCAGCRMEETTMTELTGKVRNAPKGGAPARLRGKVLGAIEFGPTAHTQRWPRRARWAMAGGLLAALVVAAVVTPAFHRAREVATKSAAAQNMKELGTAVEEKYGGEVRAMQPRNSGAGSTPTPSTVRPTRPAFPEIKSASEGIALMIVKTADLTVEVKNFQRAYDQAVSIAKSAGGYVTDSSAASEETVPTSGSLTLRVPADAFERTVERLGRLGIVKSRSISGQDVTGEAVDLQSRLRNKRAEERQYLQIMERARRVSDIVTVSNELYRVREEIEQAEGRLKYLKSAAAMSTIDLALRENVKAKPVPKSSIERTFGSALASLGRTASGLAALVIWLAVYSPVWGLPLAAALYLRRKALPAQ